MLSSRCPLEGQQPRPNHIHNLQDPRITIPSLCKVHTHTEQCASKNLSVRVKMFTNSTRPCNQRRIKLEGDLPHPPWPLAGFLQPPPTCSPTHRVCLGHTFSSKLAIPQNLIPPPPPPRPHFISQRLLPPAMRREASWLMEQIICSYRKFHQEK